MVLEGHDNTTTSYTQRTSYEYYVVIEFLDGGLHRRWTTYPLSIKYLVSCGFYVVGVSKYLEM